MSTPLFSQIPKVVLDKFLPKPKTKRVKFHEDIPEENETEEVATEHVSSSWSSPETIVLEDELSNDEKEVHQIEIDRKEVDQKEVEWKENNLKEIDYITQKPIKQYSDAIIQVEVKLVDAGTQTEVGFNDFVSLKDHQDQIQNQCLGYKPMYSIPKKEGEQPPLKIGLSLPGGRKKRKIYYPDDEE